MDFPWVIVWQVESFESVKFRADSAAYHRVIDSLGIQNGEKKWYLKQKQNYHQLEKNLLPAQFFYYTH